MQYRRGIRKRATERRGINERKGVRGIIKMAEKYEGYEGVHGLHVAFGIVFIDIPPNIGSR